MTQTDDHSSLPELSAPKSPCRKTRCRVLALGAFLVLAVAAAAFYILPQILAIDGRRGSASLENRLQEIERQVQILDGRVNDLGARMERDASSVSSTATPAESTADIARMKNDLVSLSAALTVLQDEVKRASGAAGQTRQAAQASIATFIAFTQMRVAAMAGKPFAVELETLRAASLDNTGLQARINALDSYAAHGAPTLAALRERFAALTPSVEVAIGKANAANWWQRLLAETRGLVSVRSLHGGNATPDDIVTAIESALERGDLADAFDHYDKLPPEAQVVLNGWRKDGEARRQIDDILSVMGNLFLAQARPANASAPFVSKAPAGASDDGRDTP